jgi:hypothetical protein
MMIDIPLNKALMPIEKNIENNCEDCVLVESCNNANGYVINWTVCLGANRKDGKDVIFKLVDLPGDNKTP